MFTCPYLLIHLLTHTIIFWVDSGKCSPHQFPDKNGLFVCDVLLVGRVTGRGYGNTRHIAKRQAAVNTITWFKENEDLVGEFLELSGMVCRGEITLDESYAMDPPSSPPHVPENVTQLPVEIDVDMNMEDVEEGVWSDDDGNVRIDNAQ